MRKLMQKVKLWRGLTAVMCVALSLAVFLTALLFSRAGIVNTFLNVEVPTIDTTDDTTYYNIGYEMSSEGLKQMISDSDKHDIQTKWPLLRDLTIS